MAQPADLALRNLKKVLSRDPLLRDVMEQTMPTPRAGGRFVPDVDVLDGDSEYIVLLDMPGVPKDQVEITLDGNRLVVRGTKARLHQAGASVHTGERRHGGFERIFLLPSQVRGDDVSAKLEDGVLRVRLPKSGDSRVKRVPIGE